MMFHTVLKTADAMVSQLKTEPNLEMIEMKNVLGNFTTVNWYLKSGCSFLTNEFI